MSEPPDVVGDDQLAEQSAARLAAGQLPMQAADRLGRMRRDHSYTSDLTTGEFAAVRSVGFEPAGQVLGTCVYQIGYSGTWACGVGYGYGGPGYGYRGYGRYGAPGGMPLGGLPGGMVGRGMGRAAGMPGGFAGPLSMGASGAGGSVDPGYPVLEPERLPGSAVAMPLVHSLREARRLATDRLREECEALGADGVVAVRLSIGPFPGTNAVEFRALGTAVRAAGSAQGRSKLKHPFLSDLSGQDFAKLMMSGWVPCGLAYGISVVVRHDSWATRAATSFGNVGNTEVPGYTALVQETRKAARHALEEEVHAVGGDGVVVGDMTLQIGEHECVQVQGGRDHLAEVVIVGTALARFKRTSTQALPRTLPVLRLSRDNNRIGSLGPGPSPSRST